MSLSALRLAAELGGARLSGAGGSLVLVERVRAHGLPTLALLGREPGQLQEALGAWERSDAALNLTALLPAGETKLLEALQTHRRRIGALTAALDVSLPWLEGKPMLAKRLPGRVAGDTPLDEVPMGPIEKSELSAFLADWSEVRLRETFLQPPSIQGSTLLWPDVPVPKPSSVLIAPLRLPIGDPLLDALRDALRRALNQPIPLLPLPEDPSGLHALRTLTPKVAAFRGPGEAWERVFLALADLPAPPHFCARC